MGKALGFGHTILNYLQAKYYSAYSETLSFELMLPLNWGNIFTDIYGSGQYTQLSKYNLLVVFTQHKTQANANPFK